MESIDWVSLFGNMGIGGILVWYLYYTTTKTLPAMQESHAAAMGELIAEFRSDLKEERHLRVEMHRDLQSLLIQLGTRPCLLNDDSKR